ncbi:MAG: hypothetical protein PHF37_01455 [Phycisphaerae bacterium]|nr:hypothetical protein [Phycisphaerae bacterium]
MKMKKFVVLLTVLSGMVFLVSPAVYAGTTIYQTDFESFTAGDVNGQDGWVVTAPAGDINDGPWAINGTKSLMVYTSGADVRKSFTPQSGITITVEYSIDTSVNNKTVRLDLMNSAGTHTGPRVEFKDTGNIVAYDSTTGTAVGAYSGHIVYNVRLEVDIFNQTYDLYVDDVLKADNFAFYNGTSSLGLFRIQRYTTSPVYIDDLSITSSAVYDTLYTTGFESPTFTTGTVAGQDGWTITAGAGDIFTGTGVIAGAQSLKVYYSGANADVRKSFASQTTTATLAFKTTALNTNRTSQFDLLNATTTRTAARVLFNGTGYITAYNGTTATDLMTYAAQTYDIRIVADIAAKTYDVYVDNVLKANDYAFYDNLATDIGTVRIMRYTSVAVNVDDLTIYGGLIGCGDWGYLPADLNEDCYVDFIDFGSVADGWLNCTQPSDSNCL